MDPHKQRRLTAAGVDASRNVIGNIPYYVKLALLIPTLMLRHTYEKHKDQITILSAVEEKTMPVSKDTTVFLPEEHFVAVSHSEEIVDEIDAVVRRIIQQDQ
jgi:hypothetical protein